MVRFGFFLLAIGAGLMTILALTAEQVMGFNAFLSVPAVFISVGIALHSLFWGGLILLLVAGRQFLRACKRSLALNGLALCGVSVIAGVFWSLRH
ncbi:MAG: hypothetical protein AB7W16_01785 [Candidatus Obscuribacterales bacterium]